MLISNIEQRTSNLRPTLGLLLHFFDFRNDVRVLISELAAHVDVVLLVRPEDEERIRGMAGPEAMIRLVRERKASLANRLWDQAFAWVGRLPKSRKNFYLMEIFKISLQPLAAVRRRALARLGWRMRLPELLGYDTYLDRLDYTGQTDLAGLDGLLCFTEIADSYLLARLMREGRLPVHCYVYSWDHPCKHTRFSKRLQYLVWSRGMAEDMTELQGVAPERLAELGASQFGYVERYQCRPPREDRFYDKPYVYFGCAIGLPGLIGQEVAVVEALAAELAVTAPDWLLVVRPYPVLADWSAYDSLRALPNVVMDEGFRTGTLAVADDAIAEKFDKMAQAEAFLHLGTTLGLECCFTNTPSFLVDFEAFAADRDKEGLALYHFVHQYQNDKYLARRPGANLVDSTEHFGQIVGRIRATGKADYLRFNEAVRADFPVRSFSEIARGLVDELKLKVEI